jgi:NAD(P)-dependent dehydrogenase (short-subunit alcohol dehydrogenase family)
MPRLYLGILENPTIFVQYGWELCMEVMLVGATRGVMMAVDRMSTKKGRNGGRIINTASMAGVSVT